MAWGKCRGKPRFLGSRRGAAARGCIRAGELSDLLGTATLPGSAAALGYFQDWVILHFWAFVPGAWGMFPLRCFGKLEVPRVRDWSQKVVLDWLY